MKAFSPVHDGLVDPGVGAIAEGGLRGAVHALLDGERELEHFVRLCLAPRDDRRVHAVVHHLEEAELRAS